MQSSAEVAQKTAGNKELLTYLGLSGRQCLLPHGHSGDDKMLLHMGPFPICSFSSPCLLLHVGPFPVCSISSSCCVPPALKSLDLPVGPQCLPADYLLYFMASQATL